ncbi:hypothetical protein [Streptomyces pseudovenezuelae]|uniref:hypothetical protein n=1 Tax=Streptomyces pseudovenezuelae TaxID=67350 RepID=UPI002E301056|nr:hypothetical protein [Streptomyces pseudovenezuelae]
MRRLRRVTALTWSRLGYSAGCLAAAVGFGLEVGVGWGLVVGGAVGAASCLLLVDVDGLRPQKGGDGL